MNINKNSWHFKLNKLFKTDVHATLEYEAPVSLCDYVWSTVGCILGCVMLVLFVIMLFLFTLLMLTPLYFLITMIVGVENVNPDLLDVGHKVLIGGWITAPIVFGVIAGLSGEMKIVPKWLKFNVAKPEQTRAVTPPLNIFKEYLKAKKAKFCPLVELEKDDK